MGRDGAEPATGRDETLRLTRDMLLGLVRAALYAPTTASALPAALDAAAQGRFHPLLGWPGRAGPAAGDAALAKGMHFSGGVQRGTCRSPRITATAPAPDFGASLAALYVQVCGPGHVARRYPSARAAGAVPTLLLSGGIDRPPPRHGARVARARWPPQARMWWMPNAGHG